MVYEVRLVLADEKSDVESVVLREFEDKEEAEKWFDDNVQNLLDSVSLGE